MDKRLSESIKILDALEVYFENISGYLRDNDQERFRTLSGLIEKAIQIKAELKTHPSSTLAVETIFKLVHLFTQLGRLMTLIYGQLNFQLPVSEELSKTRAYKLMSLFDDITSVYKVYIKDLETRNRDLVNWVFPHMSMTIPLKDVQALFHKYPMAIDLYVKYMTVRLNAGDMEVLQLVELDKSHVLGEPKWTSPFLSFNLVPDGKTYDMKELAAKIGSKETKFDKMAKTVGIIAWHREQPSGVIYHLPQSLDFTRGICTQDAMTPLEQVTAKTYKWDVKIYNDDAKEFLCVETLDGHTWRIMQFKGRMLTPKLAIAKLLERQNGRPQAYNGLLEKAFLASINPHIRGAFGKDFTKRDIQPHIQMVHAGLLKWFQEEKGTTAEKLSGVRIIEVLRELLVKEIDTKEIETFLYSLTSLETQFQKDFAKRPIPQSSIDDQTIWFAKESKDILTTLIKKHENIFQILYQKAYLKDNLKYLLPANKS